jgi:hypothetical protein
MIQQVFDHSPNVLIKPCIKGSTVVYCSFLACFLSIHSCSLLGKMNTEAHAYDTAVHIIPCIYRKNKQTRINNNFQV